MVLVFVNWNLYKKNLEWVFLSKSERFWPWLASLTIVSLVYLIIDLMKNIII